LLVQISIYKKENSQLVWVGPQPHGLTAGWKILHKDSALTWGKLLVESCQNQLQDLIQLHCWLGRCV